MPFIYSTLTADNKYSGYQKGGGDIPSVTWEVLVKGGTGVANNRLITPQGVVTEVTDEELARLKENVIFNRHVENGFIVISDKREDPEKVAADMTGRDPSAPLVDADFEVEGKKAPTHTGKRK